MSGTSKGKLWIVSTPIGNLEDMTLRAIRILKEVPIILAEDTRRTSTLLKKIGIEGKKLISFNAQNQNRRLPQILSHINAGQNIALVSDAGTPVISDPGSKLISECHKFKIETDIVPGPSAVTSAVAISGFPGTHFVFLGFLPRGKNRRRLFRKIAEGLYGEALMVFFESPQRIKQSLKEWLEIVGDRECFIARELTKIHQELIRGPISEILKNLPEQLKGEITVVISGNSLKKDNSY
ncbi:ribosomal RNA small subunit methyltransferase I [Kosmotoga arenicorallina S304]|uniref:Ribosomal RNA small subunit methyltransferase I n=1 Tax=Kosmotoga arenicorallina S304 TaxID=1453497 RepID=A0A182C795_9BACT|nr:16S rRNA (cytidine(1402)-2'-O)-methyltransferase [Kosmotoga arenicorallina]OAA31391.1 ribosomal RNA small subunit methyltransferase I [Kosmotoga arenicorallina S304]